MEKFSNSGTEQNRTEQIEQLEKEIEVIGHMLGTFASMTNQLEEISSVIRDNKNDFFPKLSNIKKILKAIEQAGRTAHDFFSKKVNYSNSKLFSEILKKNDIEFCGEKYEKIDESIGAIAGLLLEKINKLEELEGNK